LRIRFRIARLSSWEETISCDIRVVERYQSRTLGMRRLSVCLAGAAKPAALGAGLQLAQPFGRCYFCKRALKRLAMRAS
jgi:hypothetical protein